MSILFLEVQQSHNHLIEVVRSPFFLINMMLLRYYTTCHTALYYLSGLLLSRSLFEMSLFTCSRMRTLTTISCAQESASHGDLPVIENSEPPQGARVLTDEQSRLTPTDANG